MGNKSRLKPVSWRGMLFRDSQGGVTFPPAFVSDVRGYGYDRIGSNNPNYRVLIKSGKNATGSMTVTVLNSESEDQDAELYRRGSADPSSPEYSKVYRSGMTGVHLSLNLPVPIGSHYSSASFVNACAEAKRIAHKRLTQRRRQFQGSVAVWELKKTLQMVKSPAKELRRQVAVAARRIPRVMKLLKRSRASRSTKVKALADTYLEVTFGWQPLLSDTRDGALALARLATRDALERQQFRAYGKTETPGPTSFGNNYQVGYDANSVLIYDREWRQKTVEECIIYGRFQVRLEDSSYCKATSLRLAELCGFSFADALPSAWEAMPWSFLVDYFTNVGDVLEAFANCVGDIAWASEVHIQTSQEDFLARFNEPATRAYHGGLYLASSSNSLHAISSRKSVVRVPTGVDLSTYLRFSLPQGLQWLNIGALVAGARPPKPFY